MKVCHCYIFDFVMCLYTLMKGLAELQTKLANLILGLKQPSIDEIAGDVNGLVNPTAGGWGQPDANGKAAASAPWGSSSPKPAAGGGWGANPGSAGGWGNDVSPSNAGGGWGNNSSPASSGGGWAGWGSPSQQASGWNV